MDLRLVAILMAVAIVMDIVGRMTRRRMADEDPAQNGEQGSDFLAALAEAGRERPEGTGPGREGDGEAGRGGEWARGRTEEGAREVARVAPPQRERERPPSVFEVLAGVAAPAGVEAARRAGVVAAGRGTGGAGRVAEAPDAVVAGRDRGRAVERTPPGRERDSRREGGGVERGETSPPLPGPATVRARNRVLRPRLKGDRQLRKAFVAREILGPPVALRDGAEAASRNDIR